MDGWVLLGFHLFIISWLTGRQTRGMGFWRPLLCIYRLAFTIFSKQPHPERCHWIPCLVIADGNNYLVNWLISFPHKQLPNSRNKPQRTVRFHFKCCNFHVLFPLVVNSNTRLVRSLDRLAVPAIILPWIWRNCCWLSVVCSRLTHQSLLHPDLSIKGRTYMYGEGICV